MKSFLRKLPRAHACIECRRLIDAKCLASTIAVHLAAKKTARACQLRLRTLRCSAFRNIGWAVYGSTPCQVWCAPHEERLFHLASGWVKDERVEDEAVLVQPAVNGWVARTAVQATTVVGWVDVV